MTWTTGDRRLKVLRLDPTLFVRMFRAGEPPFEFEPLPADVEVVAVERDSDVNYRYNTIGVVLHSANFEAVPEGQYLPEYRLLFTRCEVDG